jgi:hypothetical protein
MLTNSYHSFFMVNVVQQQDTSLFRQMTERVTNDKNQNTKVVGCRVDAKEYNFLKQWQLFSSISRFKILRQSKTEDCLNSPITGI